MHPASQQETVSERLDLSVRRYRSCAVREQARCRNRLQMCFGRKGHSCSRLWNRCNGYGHCGDESNFHDSVISIWRRSLCKGGHYCPDATRVAAGNLTPRMKSRTASRESSSPWLASSSLVVTITIAPLFLCVVNDFHAVNAFASYSWAMVLFPRTYQ